MKRTLITFFLFVSLIVATFAQENEILLTIGNTKVSKAEFERIYRKNNNNLYNESDKKSPKEYLDLFVDFKLKVIEAQALKMDTNTAFVNELAGYRKELAAPYLTDVKFNDKLVHELYDRTTKEVNASHILLQVEKGASEEQWNEVLEKINKIRQEIIDGKDFGEAAIEYSEDPSAKTNKGNLGFFSAFQMVVPFENAAFSTAVGEVSEPVKTSFGWHLLKVHEIRKNQGEILVAHIMKMFPQGGATPELKARLKAEIDSLYKQVIAGADFAELAKEKSDDKNSAGKGGQMPWFAAGRMIPEFAKPAFELENIGDISEVVESDFGYHIIKKLDVRPVKSFEDSKKEIEDKIKRDPARSTYSKTAFLNKLKEEYGFQEYKENVTILKKADPSDSINAPELEIFKIDNAIFTYAQFKAFLKENNWPTETFSAKYAEWEEHEITKLEDSKLEEKYPDFRYLYQEYHDGILLFNISEEKIWNYAVEDSLGLENYFSKHHKVHLWEERFKGSIIECTTSETRELAEKFYAEDMSNEEILDQLNTDSAQVITITEGAWEKGSNPIVDYFVWNGVEPEAFKNELTFIRGDKIPPEPKKLEDARGLYISDYQNYLEKEWLKLLRKKYKIRVNKKLLKTIEGV